MMERQEYLSITNEIIDKTGKEIVEPKYSVMYYPYEGLIGILKEVIPMVNGAL